MKDYHFENDNKEFDTTIRLDHINEKVKELEQNQTEWHRKGYRGIRPAIQPHLCQGTLFPSLEYDAVQLCFWKP